MCIQPLLDAHENFVIHHDAEVHGIPYLHFDLFHEDSLMEFMGPARELAEPINNFHGDLLTCYVKL
jgi:hypothetical protein